MTKQGLLWYDANPNTPIAEKIAAAAQRYYERFGLRPNICYVNPAALQGATLVTINHRPLAQLLCESKSTILPNHVWVGLK